MVESFICLKLEFRKYGIYQRVAPMGLTNSMNHFAIVVLSLREPTFGRIFYEFDFKVP